MASWLSLSWSIARVASSSARISSPLSHVIHAAIARQSAAARGGCGDGGETPGGVGGAYEAGALLAVVGADGDDPVDRQIDVVGGFDAQGGG